MPIGIIVGMTRLHIVLDDAEKERFRRQAAREGKSLGAWLREAARERLAKTTVRRRLDTHAELRAFWAEIDARETEPEPDWEEHRRVIEESMASGATDT